MGATATTRIGELETENGKLRGEKAKADKAKANSTGLWGFITRPYTLWCDARNPDIQVKGQTSPGKMGVWGSLKHALWPSSTGGKLAYAAGAATVAAGVVGGLKYAEHREDKRKSDSRKKWGLAAAGVAATGVAALGLYKGYEAYQTQQEPDEYSAEAGELQTPEKENSQAVGAGSSTKKSGKTTNTKKVQLDDLGSCYRARSGCHRWSRLLLPLHE